MRRPATMREVVAAAEREGDPFARLREFLDEFYSERHDRQAMIADDPGVTDDRLFDVYLAAAAEHLARLYRLRVPSWALADSRILEMPYFAEPEGMKGIWLVESPIAFRRRNLFVGHDPLSRPGRREQVATPATWWTEVAASEP